MSEPTDITPHAVAVIAESQSERFALAAPFRRFGGHLEELERADDLRLIKTAGLVMVVATPDQVAAARRLLDEDPAGRLVPVLTMASPASLSLGTEAEEMLAHARELSRDQEVGEPLDREASQQRARYSTDAVAIGPYRPDDLPQLPPPERPGEPVGDGSESAESHEKVEGATSFDDVNQRAGISMPIIGLTLLALIVALVVLIISDAREENSGQNASESTNNGPRERAAMAASAVGRYVGTRAEELGGQIVPLRSAPALAYRPEAATLDASSEVRCLAAVQDERWTEALSACAMAIGEEPRAAPLFAAALVATGSTPLAVGLLREYVTEEEGDASGWIIYGDALSRLGDESEARRAWQRYLELDPEGRWAADVRRVLEEEPAEASDEEPEE